MRVVVDGLAIRGENSLSIVSEHLLSGWQGIDELHIVLRSDHPIPIPAHVTVHPVEFGRSSFGSRLYAQTFTLPRLCRSLDADVMLGLLPTTAISPLPCPRAVIAWDLRYRLLPEQFSRKALLLRRVSYAIGFRQADGVACISERTKRDLLGFHPRLAKVPVRVAHLGADHVDQWPVRPSGMPYAIAFGHFSNKNVDLVLDALAALRERGGETRPLRLVGVPGRDRPHLDAKIASLGLATLVTVSPWLPKESFQEQFASSSLVVFPSDFEGFGLPAVEAMRLGIPLVITPDPALLEVTNGHTTVVDGEGPLALAEAIDTAGRMTAEERAAAKRYAEQYTWVNFASGVRGLLAEAVAPAPQPRPVRWLRPIPLRIGGAIAAGALAVSGATAASFALVSSHPHHPTTSDSTTAPAHATGSPTPTTSGFSGPSHGTAGGRAPASTRPPSPPSPSRSSTSPTAPVGVATTTTTLPMPSVSIPPVSLPPVTVPPTVCVTTTTVTIPVVTVPCGLSVSGPGCPCP
jgi:glycosyltransferase involved in cell wall biosynthesis